MKILAKRFGTKEAIKIISDAKFDAYDFTICGLGEDSPIFGDDYLNYAKDLRSFADERGIICNQAHAPFPSSYGEKEKDEKVFSKKITEFRKEVKKYMQALPNTDEKLIAADFTELFLKVDGSQSYYQIKSEFWPGDEHKAVNSIEDQLDYVCNWYSKHFSKEDKNKENKYKRYCNSLT